MRPQVCLKRLLPGKDSVAVSALDGTGGRGALQDERVEDLRPGPSAARLPGREHSPVPTRTGALPRRRLRLHFVNIVRRRHVHV